MLEKITELFWDGVYFVQDKWQENKRNKIIIIVAILIILSLIFKP